jgi:amino acid transporter
LGAGIFALPATLYTQFGEFSPWLFPLFGALALIVALPYAKVVAYHPISGGPVVYAAAFGPAASFQAGWLYDVARATALAANANVLVTYLATLWSPLADGAARAVTIIAAIGAITAINIVGVKRAVGLLDALTLLKAAPLLFAAILGLVVAGDPISAPTALPPLTQLEAAALLVFYASSGSRTASCRPARRAIRSARSRARSSSPSWPPPASTSWSSSLTSR